MVHSLRPVGVAVGMLLLQLSVSAQSVAPPPVVTRVTVHAVARDAKLLHDSVGGARITITDAQSGRILAEGVQRGNSGDTQRLMVTGRVRGASLYDTEGAAKFVAEVLIAAPTLVHITAEGPLTPAHAAMRASKTILLMPGQHIEGDGVVLELHGFIINANLPVAIEPGTPLRIAANIEMLCGCPISPGGMWDANTVTAMASVFDNSRLVSQARLTYAGRSSTFSGEVSGLPAGEYTVEITAASAETANFGIHRRALTVRDEPGVRTEEVTFRASDITVAATLFLPDGAGPFPAIVTAHGSEPGSRNQGGKRQQAIRLARQGIAVLIPDKRGVALTGGVYVETDWIAVLSGDQLAGVRYLKTRADIAHDRVGVMGGSQGGWVSQLSAASGEVAFGVSVSGPGVSPLVQVVAQRINERIEDGMSEGDAAELRAWWLRLWTYYATSTGYDEVMAASRALPDKPWFSAAREGRIPTVERLKSADFDFYRKLVAYDPAVTLEKIQVPFLSIFGERDRHIPMPDSADATRRAFARSRNRFAEVRVFSGAGHGIQPVEDFERLRGPRVPTAPLPEYIAFLDAWLVGVTRPGGR